MTPDYGMSPMMPIETTQHRRAVFVHAVFGYNEVATVCRNACRTCVTSNIIGIATATLATRIVIASAPLRNPSERRATGSLSWLVLAVTPA
jgi:hypothetical protein